jgi:hypothetical protein
MKVAQAPITSPRQPIDYRGNAGWAKFDQYLFPGMPRNSLSYRISDHYPLWVEFLMPPS